MVAEEVDFLDAVSMSAFEDDVVVSPASEEGFESPCDAVDEADLSEVMHGLHLFGNGAADGGSKHGLEIHVKASFGCVEGFFERAFDHGKEGFHELGIACGFFDIFESGEGFLVI